MTGHVVIRSSRSGMVLYLDPDCPFDNLLSEIRDRFSSHADFWGNIQLVLSLEGRELTGEQELDIINAITENTGIEILSLLDQDADRIERYEKAMNDRLMELSAQTGRFYRGNLGAGETLETGASIVILGNVLPGARVTAKGNIIVLGALKGCASAGVSGDRETVIAALEMDSRSLRIASVPSETGVRPHRLGRGAMAVSLEKGELCMRPIRRDFWKLLKI